MIRSALLAILPGIPLGVCAVAAHASPERHALDPEHTTVAFLVEHVGFARTLGRFTETSGAFTWDPDTRELSALRIVVKTRSVATDHDARDEHVRGADFLDVTRYPEMTFEASGPIDVEGDAVRVDGELTLRGRTRPLALEVTLNKAGEYPFGHGKETLGISARGALRRSEFGMEYAVANELVGDRVELIVEAEAPRE